MKILSIQIGLPQNVVYQGKTVTTGIFKTPVQGPVKVSFLNLEGDSQADLQVHGGPDKAVYAFSFDTYPWWQQNRPQDTFDYGALGENLTLDKMPEDKIYIGDTFEVGEALLQVTQPRFPCYKLGIKFKDPKILKQFMTLGRPGIYFRVLREGMIDRGQELKLIDREKVLLSIVELFLLSSGKITIESSRVLEFLEIKSLMPVWKVKLESFL